MASRGNPRGNPQNLIPNLPPEKQPSKEQIRENARKAGQASAAARAKRKTLKEELLLLLSEGDVQKRMSTALIKEATEGNNAGSVVQAFRLIMEAIGEKPRDELEIGNLDDKPLEVMDLSKLSDEQLKAILAKK